MTINLRELIDQRGLRLQEVAEILFPDNRFPPSSSQSGSQRKNLVEFGASLPFSSLAWGIG